MLRLPPGFDYSALFSDYLLISVPFVAITGLIVAYQLLKSAVDVISSGDV